MTEENFEHTVVRNLVTYNPRIWYWLADDGRVFSGNTESVIDSDDREYNDFLSTGVQAARWPEDETGKQTEQSLQTVLDIHGMHAHLPSYAASARYKREVSGIDFYGVPVATDDRAKTLIFASRIVSQADANKETSFVDRTGTVHALKADQVIELSEAVANHVHMCFETYSNVLDGIKTDKIKTRDAIDAAFAEIK